ncbi:unnamed protein product [Spirodela intermedia]|uniref:Uncharacterized protein n=1 Tax=Spirodela intermedia TaxID=51605 RepID=A0A7I8L925_SPIIN|nr:unnamed protein product [Spirodela intermedia]
MAGLFARFSGRSSGHRRNQSATQGISARGSSPNAGGVASASGNPRGVEEFKPVEHPSEPVGHDQPIKCPLPEPSILNDGRIWKERRSANARARSDLPVARKIPRHESKDLASSSYSGSSGRVILPSLSAPEQNIAGLLEDCNAARGHASMSVQTDRE